MRYLIISTSLNPKSKSRIMAQAIFEDLQGAEDVRWMDLQEQPLPFCDASSCYGDPAVALWADAIREADGVILASSIYNFDVNAAAKNLLEVTGQSAWKEKVVGFVCAAGGRQSYMSVMGVANSMMLDFRAVIVPRFVYAVEDAFSKNDEITDEDVRQRLKGLGEDLVRMTSALRG